MAQISAGIISTRIAVTFRIQWSRIALVLLSLNTHSSLRRKESSISSNSRGHYAVKHIHSTFNRNDQVEWSSDAHQVTWFVLGHSRSHFLEQCMHQMNGFTDAKSTESIAWQVHTCNGL